MKIYLAAPYTHKNQKVIEARVKEINHIASTLLLMDHIVYSPISMFHSIAKENFLPITEDFYREQNEEFIKWCEAIILLQLPGWEKSIGFKKEIALAKKYKKLIIYYKRKK